MRNPNTQLKKNEEFERKAYLGALFPCMLAVMGNNINILVDGILVGQKLGVNGLAALNLCVPVYLFLCVIGSLIVSGTAICAAISTGKNETKNVQRYYHLAIGYCIAISAVISVVGVLGIDYICAFLCRQESLLDLVKTYVEVTLIGALPKVILYVPFWFLRLDGRNKHVTAVMCTMAASNIMMDYIFLFVLDMGIFGAALASVLATLIATVLGFVFLCEKKSTFKFGIAFRIEWKTIKQILHSGSPAAINNLAQALRVLLINSILLLYGNTVYIAMFAVVNCISEFSLCIIQGVPQAASAMLGVYCGEKDNSSARILMRLQWKYGLRYTIYFAIIVIACSQLFGSLYGLDVLMYFAMICLASSIFPALLNGIFSGYYSVSGNSGWANLMILCRVLLFPVAFIYMLYLLDISPWLFMPLGEAAAIFVWWVGICLNDKRDIRRSKYLLMNDDPYREGEVMDFSVAGNTDAICDACQRISEFCEKNDLSMKQIMKLSLSMEELMTMILKENDDEEIYFDLRLYAVQEIKGIRIRYNGKEFNPFADKSDFDEMDYLGIKMIYNLVDIVLYQRTFGMNMLQIMI